MPVAGIGVKDSALFPRCWQTGRGERTWAPVTIRQGRKQYVYENGLDGALGHPGPAMEKISTSIRVSKQRWNWRGQ